MISLEKTTQVEFNEYVTIFVAEYSKELNENYNYSFEGSVAKANRELEESFPKGVATTGNYLLSIKHTDGDRTMVVGYLWYLLKRKSDHAFICDFYIHKKHRNKGFGKATIKCLENLLSATGVNEIRLRVAYSNGRALKLYKQIGFNVTGLNMIKKLE